MAENDMKKSLASNEWECSMIAEVALSVVRDRAVSSLYGFKASLSGRFATASEVFVREYASRVDDKLHDYASMVDIPLYSGNGELLGQLARLLIVCNEKTNLSGDYRDEANREIKLLGVDVCGFADGDIIRRLRNAVMHCHYEVHVDASNPMNTRFVFDDRGKTVSMNPKQVEAMMDILLEKVCFGYLKDAGWRI